MKQVVRTFLATTLLLGGCATGPQSGQVKASLPAPASDNGRIYFYRTSALPTKVEPVVRLDGQAIGVAVHKKFFYVDRPPGNYTVELSDGEPFRTWNLSLDKGRTRYVRIDFPGENAGGFFKDIGLFAVSLPFVVLGTGLLYGGVSYNQPVFVDDTIGVKQISKCSYAGSYWTSFGDGGGICEASAGGDLNRVRKLLNGNSNLVFLKDTNGWTPLYFAISSGSKDVAAFLLASGADVNARTIAGWTPLHWATFYDRRDMAELLLAHQADANARDNLGRTPLHDAAYSGFTNVVGLLLANQADVDARNNRGQTPLHDAATWGHGEIVELLLAHGADVNAKDKGGATPLHWAALGRYKEVVKLLRQHGGKE